MVATMYSTQIIGLTALSIAKKAQNSGISGTTVAAIYAAVVATLSLAWL